MLWRQLRDERWTLLGWAVGMAGMAAMIIGMYPSFNQNRMLTDFVASMPKWFEAFAGGAVSFASLDGWLSWEWFSWSSWLMGAAGVISAAAIIARDVEIKSVEFLLAQPVRRWRVVVERYLAVAAMLLALHVAAGATLEVGARLIDMPASLNAYRIAMLNDWLLTLVIAAIAALASALASEQKRTMIIGLGAMFGSYLVEVVLRAVDKAPWLRAMMPFHYYDANRIIRTGEVPWGDMAVLLAAAVVLVAAAALAFERRDVAA